MNILNADVLAWVAGTLGDELGNLTQLGTLRLPWGKLGGTLPASHGQAMKKLTVLELSNNSFAGQSSYLTLAHTFLVLRICTYL